MKIFNTKKWDKQVMIKGWILMQNECHLWILWFERWNHNKKLTSGMFNVANSKVSKQILSTRHEENSIYIVIYACYSSQILFAKSSVYNGNMKFFYWVLLVKFRWSVAVFTEQAKEPLISIVWGLCLLQLFTGRTFEAELKELSEMLSTINWHACPVTEKGGPEQEPEWNAKRTQYKQLADRATSSNWPQEPPSVSTKCVIPLNF